METAFAIKNGAYPTTLPCDTWDQYEHLRLERIKQQRKRVPFSLSSDGKHERCGRAIFSNHFVIGGQKQSAHAATRRKEKYGKALSLNFIPKPGAIGQLQMGHYRTLKGEEDHLQSRNDHPIVKSLGPWINSSALRYLQAELWAVWNSA